MKILLSTGPSFGLYNPVVPLAWALRASGHDVLVAAPPGMASTVNGSGLPFVPSSGPLDMFDVMMHDRAGRLLQRPDTEEELLPHIGRGFGRLAAGTLDGMLRIIEEWRPDVVVGESHAYSAGTAARILGVPWVEHGLGAGYLPAIDAAGTEEFAPELRRYGLDGLPEPDLVLNTCPPGIRPEGTRPVQPMRYVPYDAAGTVPSWVFEERDRPRLLLTLGTRVPVGGGLPLFQELIRTLPELGVELVVAVADDVVEQLGPLPDAVRAAGWLPLSSVLASCDLAVHHCGAGTTLSAVLAGVPQLLIPRIAEQYDTARRLARYGAALELPAVQIDPAAVLDACRTLLADPSYAQAARRLRAEMAELPSPAEIVPLIEKLAANGA
ncbi:glycosyltransferase [Streptomyces virginiae]|uniref:glycosyltransferase n=1 Tax=Streptomyces virginiae TaxID=1961 RepID=UPI0022592C15|nr:glycosyltransferase [Streptomyces virginiae]MCX4957497.1 glycosyltransferase [Streptomyces virginiae]